MILAAQIAAAFTCQVATVTDGDTFRCTEGPPVRLRAIDAPETRRCRRGRVCAPGNGQVSKRALERMIAGRVLRCRQDGWSYRRRAAWCSLGGRDVSCAMFRAGYAVRAVAYDRRGELCRRPWLLPPSHKGV